MALRLSPLKIKARPTLLQDFNELWCEVCVAQQCGWKEPPSFFNGVVQGEISVQRVAAWVTDLPVT